MVADVKLRPAGCRFLLPNGVAAKPRLLLQLDHHTLAAVQQPPEVITRERIVGVRSNQCREGGHCRGIVGCESDKRFRVLRRRGARRRRIIVSGSKERMGSVLPRSSRSPIGRP